MSAIRIASRNHPPGLPLLLPSVFRNGPSQLVGEWIMNRLFGLSGFVTFALMAVMPGIFQRSAIAQGDALAFTIDEAPFQKMLKEIRPKADEDTFDTIPWQISLWNARILAAKEGKPILLWEMDGHPLGCG